MGRKTIITKKSKIVYLTCFVFYLLFPFAIFCTLLFASQKIEPVNGGYVFTRAGKKGESLEAERQFIPASTIKILTSLASLKTLGPKYRFSTHFYLDKDNNLHVRGTGDPFLISEVIADIAQELKNTGLVSIGSLYLDDSLFALQKEADGIMFSNNPYDAGNGALAANFNTIAVKISPEGKSSSPEPQTPATSLLEEISRQLPPGIHRVNLTAYDPEGKKNLNMRSFGEILLFFLKKSGVKVNGNIEFGKGNRNLTEILVYQSPKTVLEVITACLKYSNNYIANQLFLTLGAKKYGYPATWEKAERAMQDFIEDEFDFSSPVPIIVEGAGISRKNRISPAQLIEVLEKYKPWAEMTMPWKKNGLIKSGTLSDVFCYAGYLKQKNKLDPFVIMLNQKQNSRDHLLMQLRSDFP